MNPYIVEESQARYQERVDAAAAWRLEQTARVANIGLYNRVWAAIGERVVAWGMRVKAQAARATASRYWAEREGKQCQ
jgi:hypothetical protein